ncbi:MAG: response regulator [Chlorobi bacterium]|nr:response regulator [Chlorobiota bacterium]
MSDEKEILSGADYASPESDKYLSSFIILPLRMTSILSAIAGVLALLFVVRSLSLEIYIGSLVITVVSFIVLVFSQTDFGKRTPELLVHAMIFSVVISSGFIVYRLPANFFTYSIIVSFYLFMTGLAIGWHFKNQIIAVGYFILIYAAILFSASVPYRGLDETLAIVLVLSVMSISASLVLYQNRASLLKKLSRKTSSEEDEHFLSTLDNIIEGVFRISPNGDFEFLNASFAEILGYDDKVELETKNFFSDLFQKADDGKTFKDLATSSEMLKNYIVPIKKKDGADIIARINVKSEMDHKGDPLSINGTLQDFTLQMKLEKQRKDELDALKKERKKVNYEASNAIYNSQVKSRFLAKMSHEIRTPMNSVLGFLTLIENGLFESEEELRDFAHNARVSADSLLDILNNILDISKIEAGKMEINEDEFGIREEVEKALSIVSTNAKERGLELSYSIKSIVPSNVISDATRYRQVVVNLLGNAIKYTKKGSVKIEVDLVKKTRATAKIVTRVIDTGIGIPKEKIGELFKPFTQITTESELKDKGTGLGLLICKEFVNLMGGDISIRSELEKGTTVEFTIVAGLEKNFLATPDYRKLQEENQKPKSGEDSKPARENETEPDKNQIKEETKEEKIESEKSAESASISEKKYIETSGEPDNNNDETVTLDVDSEMAGTFEKKIVGMNGKEIKRKRLLLVEDNPISQRVELRLLREAGYSVDPVSNAFDAIEAIKSNSFDLALMDIEMQDMDGIEATKKIRDLDPPMSKIPIIAVTAHSSMKDREKCLAAGMNDYIAKPINIHFMKMTIDQWLNSSDL